MADRDLTLGTVFTARLKPGSFEKAVADINKQLKKVDKTVGDGLKGLQNLSVGVEKVGSAGKAAAPKLNAFDSAVTRVGKSLRSVASYGVAASLIYSLGAAFRSATREIIDFDQALKNVEAITGATTAEMENVRDILKEVARTTKFSSTEVAEGFVLLGQSGFTVAESISAIQATSDLATGTLSSMKTSTDLMTTVIRAFNLEAIEASRVSDVMANAVNKSKLTVDKLRIAFNFVGAAAAQSGMSLEQTAATMGILANNGLRASTIGTGLRQVISRLMAPTRKLREAFEEHGIELEKINPLTQGFESAVKNLLPSIVDHEKGVIDMAKAYQLFGLRGAQAVAILGKSFLGPKFQNMLDKMYEVGTAEHMAAIQAEGLAVKLKNLADRLKVLAIGAGEGGATGIFSLLIDVLRGLTDLIDTVLNTSLGKLIANFVMIAVVVTGATTAFKLLASAMSFLKVGGWIAGAGVLGGISALITAIGVLVMQQKQLNASEETHRRSMEKSALAAKDVASKAEAYAGALENINEKSNKGADVTNEYNALMTRMGNDLPNVTKNVNFLNASFKEQIKILRELSEQKLFESFFGRQKVVESAFKGLADDPTQNLMDMKRRAQDLGVGGVASNIVGDLREVSAELVNIFSAESQYYGTREEILKQFADTSRENKIAVGVFSDGINKAVTELSHLHIAAGIPLKRINNHIRETIELLTAMPKAMRKGYADDLIAKLKKSSVDIEKKMKEIGAIGKKKSTPLGEGTPFKLDKNYIREYEIHLMKLQGKFLEAAEAQADLEQKYRDQRITDEVEDSGEMFRALEISQGIHNAEIVNMVAKRVKKQIAAQEKLTEEDKRRAEESERNFRRDLAEQIKTLERRLKLEKKGSERWLATWEEIRQKRQLTLEEEEEILRENIIANGTALEQLAYGMERARESAKKFGSVVVEIGEQIEGKIADGMTAGIMDFIDGTKSAGEAFQDFAVGVLKWLAEIIIREKILIALKAISKAWGAGAGSSGITSHLATDQYHSGGIVGQSTLPTRVVNPNVFAGARKLHSGGIVSKLMFPAKVANPNIFAGARKLHSGGLAGNEVPVILEKGEGVFTEEQMAALGNRNTEVTIVNAPTKDVMLAALATPQGKGAILNIISANPSIVRSLLK